MNCSERLTSYTSPKVLEQQLLQSKVLCAGARHFPSPWQKADQQERRKPSESFDMRSASEVAEIFDSFQRAG